MALVEASQRAWLPLASEHGFNSMIKQVCVKPDAYVILHML
jgi:hypothetical protein